MAFEVTVCPTSYSPLMLLKFHFVLLKLEQFMGFVSRLEARVPMVSKDNITWTARKDKTFKLFKHKVVRILNQNNCFWKFFV